MESRLWLLLLWLLPNDAPETDDPSLGKGRPMMDMRTVCMPCMSLTVLMLVVQLPNVVCSTNWGE